MSTKKNRRRPSNLPAFATDCGKTGHARKGCYCERCVYTRNRARAYQVRRRAENLESARLYALDRYHNGKAKESLRRYEKTLKGYLVRSYRNMKSRVEGIQKRGSWTGKELLPKEEFYRWSLANPDYQRLHREYEESGYDRMLAPSPDRVDPERGYTLDNIRWVTHAENSMRVRRKSKLTEDNVRQIRRDSERGVPATDLAKQYDVSYQNVRAIICRATWKNVA